jgi:hypothetical protein
VEEYERAGHEPTLYFHNPNIHPYMEFQRRLHAIGEWASLKGIPLISDLSYPLEENVAMLLSGNPRCALCFGERLAATALKASETGFAFFGTTLSVSPYQDQELILRAGAEAGNRHGVEFVYIDCRPRYRDSVHISRTLGMYRQPYCGCVFSERDRYCRTPKIVTSRGIDSASQMD